MKGKDQREKTIMAYIAGKVYPCEVASFYPSIDSPDREYCFGHITDEHGNKWHAWPYDPILILIAVTNGLNILLNSKQ